MLRGQRCQHTKDKTSEHPVSVHPSIQSLPLQVRDGDKAVRYLNELEWVEGEIWANVWQTECIARINPSSGSVRYSCAMRCCKSRDPCIVWLHARLCSLLASPSAWSELQARGWQAQSSWSGLSNGLSAGAMADCRATCLRKASLRYMI